MADKDEDKDINEQEDEDPGEIVSNTIDDLTAAKDSHLESVDSIDSALRIVNSAKPFWVKVDRQTLSSTPTGTTALNFLQAFGNQATFLKTKSEDARDDAINILSTASAYGPVTDSAQSMIVNVPGFNPAVVQQEIDRPGRDDEYAAKFDNLDPELGKLYQQILQIRSRTTSRPAKSVLSDVRQAYDHLMRILAPDDKVRAEPGWVSIDTDKPKQVTRKQRLDYALTKSIDGESRRKTLAASTSHALTVHGELSGMYHTEKPIDPDKARAAAGSMLEVLNQWADALEL